MRQAKKDLFDKPSKRNNNFKKSLTLFHSAWAKKQLKTVATNDTIHVSGPTRKRQSSTQNSNGINKKNIIDSYHNNNQLRD